MVRRMVSGHVIVMEGLPLQKLQWEVFLKIREVDTRNG